MSGLKKVHERGVIHRDLKPENLFLDGNNLLIGDFNLSSNSLLATSMLGTPKYMCPLVIEGLPFGPYVDIWGAGMILFRMLYGIHLYDFMETNRRITGKIDYIKTKAKKIEDEGGITFPNQPMVTQASKDLIKKMLNINEIKSLTVSSILSSEVFSRYVEEDKKYTKRLSEIGIEARQQVNSLKDSIIGIYQSQMLMISQISPGKELSSKLAKAYQKALLDMKGRGVYVSKLCDACYDYFEYFDKMRTDPS